MVVAGLLLLVLVVTASPVRMSTLGDEYDSSERESGWQLVRNLAEQFKADEQDSLDAAPSEVQVEATKRSWITELMTKADRTDEAVDLMEEIQSRTSSSGLRSLKAACKAMCPKCVCGVILMPSLPVASVAVKPKVPLPPAALLKLKKKPEKKPWKKPGKKPGKRPEKPKKKPVKKPEKKPEMPKKKPEKPKKMPKKPKKEGKATKKPEKPKAIKKPKTPPPTPPAKEAIKKAKKWLHLASLESQLPDFLLDEEGDRNAYKREVDDHDPLSSSGGSLSLSNFGVD